MIVKSTENLVGNQSFIWFTGVVEDIQDPLEMGRVKVRCFGYHTADKTKITTDDLPWASVLMPVSSAAMAEIGQSATGLLQGSWVVGFFRDGTSAQDPLIMGSLPAYTTVKPENPELGFADPDAVYPLKTDVADNPIASKSNFTESYAYVKKKESYDTYVNIETANRKQSAWKLPDITTVINPVYPHNHATAFENDANTVEYDSTAGSERFSHLHKSGTFTEIDTSGNEMHVITNKRYQVIAQGDNVYVKGGCNLTIEGGCRTKITGDWDIEVQGNVIKNVYGNETIKVTGNQRETVGGTLNQSVTGAVTESYSSTQNTTASSGVTIKGATINLN